ncbi:MAG: hypothetical protein JXR46_14165 [Calditrichaceae bacterium]|nr:hypothetical protein [Calditrichaceae bacterium]MBN2710183.1 hypothetical protein [Calditrichaceae bacterium]RQV94157.1 MAG: hypothetical protein EH224_10865 [Calditrichota bacterium]
MKYQIMTDWEIPYFIIELQGPFQKKIMEKCILELLMSRHWKTQAHVLLDARKCTLDHLTTEEVKEAAAMVYKFRNKYSNGRVAWVVNKDRDVDFGMGRMFQLMHGETTGYEFQLFKSLKTAQNWIQTGIMPELF